MSRAVVWLLVALLALVAVSCVPGPPTTAVPPVTLQATDAPGVGGATGEPGGNDVITGEAMVEAIRLIRDDAGGQVGAGGPFLLEVEGYLADGCTALAEPEQERTPDGISVRLTTTRPANAICTQALVPFTVIVELDTLALSPGEYSVEVHGIHAALGITGARTPEAAAPAPSLTRERAVAPVAGDLLVRPAAVDGVEVEVSGMGAAGGSARVVVTVSGQFPDGCTSLGDTAQRLDGQRIVLSVSTVRPRDAICTQALVPFSETVEVDLKGLEAGTYTLDVNGITRDVDLGGLSTVP